MYEIEATKYFERKLTKILKNNTKMVSLVYATIEKLRVNPFDNSLRTHKVNAVVMAEAYSSRVSGDLRLIWSFKNPKTIVILLDIGGHSGSGKVYR